MADTGNPESDPDRESIERTDYRVIPFTGFGGGLVQVKDDGQACHEEQKEDNEAVAVVITALDEKPD